MQSPFRYHSHRGSFCDMTPYLEIARFNFSRFLAYPLEIGAVVLRRCIELGFLLLFWSVFAKSLGTLPSATPLIAYLLVVTSLNEALMLVRRQLGHAISRAIKSGDLTNYLLRPLPALPNLYATVIGQMSLGLIFAAATFVIGVTLGRMHNPAAWGLFAISLVPAFLLSLSYNVFLGSLAFKTTEVSHILAAASQVVRFFSGIWIPLTYFPDAVRHALLLSPLPAMAYTPAAILQGSLVDEAAWRQIAIGGAWAVALAAGTAWYWKRWLRDYDAVGL